MSYIISIKRDDDRPIEPDEVSRVIASDTELTVAEGSAAGGDMLIYWRASPDAPAVQLTLSGGVIDSAATPSNATLLKMQDIAKKLDARLVGEEGEELTDVVVTDTDATPGQAWVFMILVFAVVAAALIWWLVT